MNGAAIGRELAQAAARIADEAPPLTAEQVDLLRSAGLRAS